MGGWVAGTTFAERFGYLVFMRHALTGRAPTNAEIARATGVTDVAVLRWAQREDPPPAYAHIKALADYFQPVTEDWLVAGKGEPPIPAMYREWQKARATAAATEAATAAATTPAPKKRGRAS